MSTPEVAAAERVLHHRGTEDTEGPFSHTVHDIAGPTIS
jgi:hypothetical protein